jgi:hypothetical protein
MAHHYRAIITLEGVSFRKHERLAVNRGKRKRAMRWASFDSKWSHKAPRFRLELDTFKAENVVPRSARTP